MNLARNSKQSTTKPDIIMSLRTIMGSTSNPHSIVTRIYDEKEWLVQINDNAEHDLTDIVNVPFSIFQVPEDTVSSKPECYVPEMIALGPCHHWRSSVYQMELFKIAAAKRIQLELGIPDFDRLVEMIYQFTPSIRASYDKYLELTNLSLAWVMAIDGLFLLEVLEKRGNVQLHPSPSEAPHFQDSGERKMNHSTFTVLKDVVKLENQIPISVLCGISSTARIFNGSNSQLESPGHQPRSLSSKLIDLCKVLSPLPLQETYPDPERLNPRHLLDLLYQSIWHKEDDPRDSSVQGVKRMLSTSGSSKSGKTYDEEEAVVAEIWEDIKDSDNKAVAVVAKPLRLLITLCELLGITNILRKVMEKERVAIPSASKLDKLGVRFWVASGGLRGITYNKNVNVLSLPVFTCKATSDVVMRNLVAYETMAKSDSLVLARYMQMMSGLIHGVEDVELLKKARIIKGEVANEDVVELFRGGVASYGNGNNDHAQYAYFNTVSRPRDKTILDATIKKVNEYYKSNKKVKLFKIFKRYMRGSTKLFVVFVVVLLLVLLAVQTLCEVYTCSRLWSALV